MSPLAEAAAILGVGLAVVAYWMVGRCIMTRSKGEAPLEGRNL